MRRPPEASWGHRGPRERAGGSSGRSPACSALTPVGVLTWAHRLRYGLGVGVLLCECGAHIIRARGGSPVSCALILPAALPNSCALVSSALGPAEACRRRLARAPLVRVVIVAGLCTILFCTGPGVLSSWALQVSFACRVGAAVSRSQWLPLRCSALSRLVASHHLERGLRVPARLQLCR